MATVFFNALSVALFGTEQHSTALRVRCCVYFASHLVELSEDSLAKKYAPDFLEDLRAIVTPGGWMSVRAFKAAAHVTSSIIESVYLPVKGHSDSAARELNTTFSPDNCRESPRIFILWTRTTAMDTKTWGPNHFVPLLSRPPPEPPSEQEMSFHSPVCTVPETGAELSTSSINVSIVQERTIPGDKPTASETTAFTDSGVDELQGSLRGAKCLANDETLRLARLDVPGLDAVPNGVKENVYFVVNNSDNIERCAHGKRSAFEDDCGIWESASCGTAPSYYVINADQSLSYIRRQQGIYGKLVRGVFTPLNPQPDASDVITVRRSYALLKRCPSYKRHVTWIEGTNSQTKRQLAVVEYTGAFPVQGQEHGNSKVHGQDYIRTKRQLM